MRLCWDGFASSHPSLHRVLFPFPTFSENSLSPAGCPGPHWFVLSLVFAMPARPPPHVLNSGSTNHRCVARPRPCRVSCRCLGRAFPFTGSGSRSPLLLLAAASSSSRGVRNSSPQQHVQRRSQKHNVGHLHDNNKVNGKIEEAGVRVNKAFRQTHSRREADALVASGRVHVNGTKPEPGTRLQPGDVVTLDGKRVAWERLEPTSKKRQTKETAASSKAASTPADVRQSMKKFVYIAYNKPKGVTCTTDQKDATNLLAALQRAGVEKKL